LRARSGRNDSTNFWHEADRIKRHIFNRLRELTRFDYVDYKSYRQRFARIPEQLVAEWNRIEKEYRQTDRKYCKRLKGFLFEALFYFACLEGQATFFDAEIAEFGGARIEPHPPWMEVTPFYDIIPSLHQVRVRNRWERKVPQTIADFLVTYVDDSGPTPPSLVDVKSKRPNRRAIKKMGWQITAAMRRGFIFQVAYPKGQIEYPKRLDDWELKTPCPSCAALSRAYDKCDECEKPIFSFSIVCTYYEAKDLWSRIGQTRYGRF